MPNIDRANWDENSPILTEPRRDGALEIKVLRQGLADRIAKEHTTPAAAGVGGEHREGSAIGYYQIAEPTTKPDGTTLLDTDDEGRIWIDSDDASRTMYMWDGTAWEGVSRQRAVFVPAPLEHDGTVVDINTAFKSSVGYTNGSALSELITWSHAMKTSVGGAIPDLKYDSGAGFVTLQVSLSTTDGVGDGSIWLNQGSFVLNPGDKIRLWISTGYTIKQESAKKVIFTL